MSKNAPTSNEVADLIERFVKDFDAYISKGGSGRRKIKPALLADGKRLAELLEATGTNTLAMLRLITYVDSAGIGFGGEWEGYWNNLKAYCLRMAIRFRQSGKARKKEPTALGGDVASPPAQAGVGRAGQREAQLSRENAQEKFSSAGAQSAISPCENGAETPDKVRTYGAQVRKEDLNPELLELSEAVHKQLADIFAKIEGLDFPQTRERLISKCREFRQYVEDAQLGHEFDDTLPLQFETWWLAQRLGFGVGPVAVTHTEESLKDFYKRMGIRQSPPTGPASEAVADIHLATVHLPYGGRNLTLPIAMYYHRDGELVGRAYVPLPPENRRKLLSRFDKWITAAGNCLPSDFRPDVRAAEIDYLRAMAIFTAELILVWHAPKDTGKQDRKESIFRHIKLWHKILVGTGAAIGSIVTIYHFCAEPLKNLVTWLLRLW